MPIKKSAIKRAKQNIVRRDRNRALKKAFRLNIKEIIADLKSDPKKAQEKIAAAYKTIDKAAKENAIHKNSAARKKSRLMKKVKEATSAKPEKAASTKATPAKKETKKETK